MFSPGEPISFVVKKVPIGKRPLFLNGNNYRHSTKESDLHNAIYAAEEWYISLRAKANAGELVSPEVTQEPTFREVAEQFMKEYSILTEGQRSPRWVKGHDIRLRLKEIHEMKIKNIASIFTITTAAAILPGCAPLTDAEVKQLRENTKAAFHENGFEVVATMKEQTSIDTVNGCYLLRQEQDSKAGFVGCASSTKDGTNIYQMKGLGNGR